MCQSYWRCGSVYQRSTGGSRGRQAGLCALQVSYRILVAQIMTRIGGVCLVTIGIWVIIELGVQFGDPTKGRLFNHHGHTCGIGVGAGTRINHVLHGGSIVVVCTVLVVRPLGRSPVRFLLKAAGL